MGLVDDVDNLMRAPVQRTTFGMAGWLEGAKGVERQYHEIDIATRDAAMREMLFAMCEGHTAAIRRLAEEIEKHGC